MNTEKMAAALNTASLALAELAEAINETPESERALATAPAAAPARVDSPSPASEPSPFEDEAVTWVAPDLPFSDEGSEAQCPKHHKPYLPSKFKEGAFYCPADSDDPAWRNSKGKCRITPVNAAEYLRIKAAA